MTDQDLETTGFLKASATRVLMKALWLSRLCRPDLAYAIQRLASRVSQWSRWEDKLLLRMIGYLKGTTDLALRCDIANQVTFVQLHVYTDADLAACPFTAKSTSGIFFEIRTDHGCVFPVFWQSKKQSSVARSTTESEVIALATAIFAEGSPIADLLGTLTDQDSVVHIHEDNSSTIQIVHAGYSVKLRHAGRTHRINLASIREALDAKRVFVTFVESALQKADGLTKSITPQNWPRILELFHLERLPSMTRGGS